MPRKKADAATDATTDAATNANEALEITGNSDADQNSGGAQDAAVENGDVVVEVFDEAVFEDSTPIIDALPVYEQTSSATGQRRAETQATTQAIIQAPILTLEVGADVITQKDKEDIIWHEIKTSQVSGTHLTGILGKIERMESGAIVCVVDYKGQRIAIPMKEMMLNLDRPDGQSDYEYNERVARVLNRMVGAEIDFIVRGITGSGEERAAVASRKAAMLRLRRRYYLTNSASGKPLVYPGRIVEARIIAVSEMAIRVEVFGVETSLRSRDITWSYAGDIRDEYYVGDTVHVRVVRVIGDTPEDLRIKANIRSLTTDYTKEKLASLKAQTNCIGRVTDVRQGVMFINLVDGVRAISHNALMTADPGAVMMCCLLLLA